MQRIALQLQKSFQDPCKSQHNSEREKEIEPPKYCGYIQNIYNNNRNQNMHILTCEMHANTRAKPSINVNNNKRVFGHMYVPFQNSIFKSTHFPCILKCRTHSIGKNFERKIG